MIRNLHGGVPRRILVLLVLALGLAAGAGGGAGAGADSGPSGTSSILTTVVTTSDVGIADAVCVQRSPDGPVPCQPG
jgi:hypothetical protein